MAQRASRVTRTAALLSSLWLGCGSDRGDAGDAGSAQPDAESATARAASRPGPLGEPLLAAERRWTWIDVPASRCRDGSSTGLGLSLSHTSANVVVFLDQGGACFNRVTCELNAASYAATAFSATEAAGLLRRGLFNRDDAANPVRDWSHVFVPYCTGDVHVGNRADGSVPGVPGTQRFNGLGNLDAFLSRIVPTFPDATRVLFVGSSAGGFGVLLAAEHVARWFQTVPVIAVTDSAPPLPSSTAEPCLQRLWSELWGFRPGVLDDCGPGCAGSDGYVFPLLMRFLSRGSGHQVGVVSPAFDPVISWFLSFGRNDCAGGVVTPAEYAAGLSAARSIFATAGTPISTYYVENASRHVWLLDDATFSAPNAGASVESWLADLVR